MSQPTTSGDGRRLLAAASGSAAAWWRKVARENMRASDSDFLSATTRAHCRELAYEAHHIANAIDDPSNDQAQQQPPAVNVKGKGNTQ